MYDKVNATETTFAKGQLNNENASGYVLSNIQPGIFVTLVYNNYDHNSEFIYNITLYRTNGTVTQGSKHIFHEIVAHNSEPSTSKWCAHQK